jgi:hypothetical protein
VSVRLHSTQEMTQGEIGELSREGRIVCLLETLREAREGPGATAAPGDKRDSRVLMLPALYSQGSYAELERCLQAMSTAETTFEGVYVPRLRFHVTGYYCAPTRRVQRCRNERCRGRCHDRKAGHLVWVIERSLDAERVDVGLAWLGVRFLASIFRGEPFLPLELYERLSA